MEVIEEEFSEEDFSDSDSDSDEVSFNLTKLPNPNPSPNTVPALQAHDDDNDSTDTDGDFEYFGNVKSEVMEDGLDPVEVPDSVPELGPVAELDLDPVPVPATILPIVSTNNHPRPILARRYMKSISFSNSETINTKK